MTPEALLQAMCKRHGLSPDSGESLLPLVKKAVESPPEIRNRILFLVDRNLASKAKGVADEKRLWNELDNDVLVAVAKVLHGWHPSGEILNMGDQLKGERGKGPDSKNA